MALRVITAERQQTGEKDLAVKESDVRVLGTFATQQVPQMQLRGQFGRAREMLTAYQTMYSEEYSSDGEVIREELCELRELNVRAATPATATLRGVGCTTPGRRSPAVNESIDGTTTDPLRFNAPPTYPFPSAQPQTPKSPGIAGFFGSL